LTGEKQAKKRNEKKVLAAGVSIQPRRPEAVDEEKLAIWTALQS
jgi:hypothetical protein